ncbi:KLRG1 protein, partial [Polypterus senegalus]|nr:KLRG1 protein [Polypterus senegalus]
MRQYLSVPKGNIARKADQGMQAQDIMAQTTMSEEGTVPRAVKKDRWLNIAIVSLAGGLLLAVGAAFSVLLTWSKGKCCPDMWVQYEKDCYYLSTNQTTWSLSEDDCISRGAGLVIATHPEELNFLLLQCRSFVAFWIGLRRNPGQEWMWTDNQPFTLGRITSPNGIGPVFTLLGIQCVLLVDCPCLDWPGKCCPDMWVRYEKDCYYLSTNQTTWSLSKDDCISRGAGLVIATHPEELNFLLLQCRSFMSFWIGLRRNPGQEWMWTDNQPFTLDSYLYQSTTRCLASEVTNELFQRRTRKDVGL